MIFIKIQYKSVQADGDEDNDDIKSFNDYNLRSFRVYLSERFEPFITQSN